jgi:hypothetical protein
VPSTLHPNSSPQPYPAYPLHPAPIKGAGAISCLATNASWTTTMATHFHDMLGTDELGCTTTSLFISSLAPANYGNYDSNLRHFFAFCNAEKIQIMHATSATIVRYTAWLGLHGTIAAASLQLYLFSVNKFFRDHQQPPPDEVCELIADACRGLQLRHERLTHADARLPLPTPIALQIPHKADAL